MTDNTGSIRVSKFLRSDDDRSVIKAIGPGMHLFVQGEVVFSKYDDDLVIDPRHIMKGKKMIRTDDAPEKRVELHMHTRFSALDALTEPKKIVERAAWWGMPAIAVTDHGVAQAFPDMWQAGKKHGVKIIYGMECYFTNDMDGNSAVIGKSRLPLDTEFVAFDIETTGLNAQSDRMTEIGAVIFSGGEIVRAAQVVCRYVDERGAAQTITARGYLARAIQHEVDHLDGVLYVDRMSAIERLRYAAKLKQLAKANGGVR